MCIVYRSEKKKIVRSQINIATKTLDVLENASKALTSSKEIGQQSTAYTELLLEQTSMEKEWISEVANDLTLSKEQV